VAAQQNTGRTLRVAGSVYGVPTFDPALSRDLETNFVNRQLHRGLMQFSDDLEPEPAVAERVEVLDEGQTYRFAIRPGLSFTNGSPVDAGAVATSLSRALNPSIAGGDASQLAATTYIGDIAGAGDVIAGRLQRLTGVEVESERTLRITLTAPSGTFLMRLCSVPAATVDPGATLEVDGAVLGPAGVGPFVVTSVAPDQAIRLESSPSWFGEPIELDAVQIVTGVAASNPFNLFQAGKLDLIPRLQRELAPLAVDPASGLDAELISRPAFALSFIAFGTTSPPLDDVHVRRALAMAFPVERIANDRYQGQVLVPRGLVPQGMLNREWPDALLAYNPEAARAELAKSRYADGDAPPIEVFAADTEPVRAFSDEIARELGLDVRVLGVAWSDFLPGLSQGAYGAYSLYWGADYPDPESLLWMLFGTGSGDNYIAYDQPEFQRALDDARRSEGVATRMAGYADAERLVLEDGACLPLYQDVMNTLVRAGVHGVPATPMGVLGLESVGIGER
jgi:ABC-type transport system substrate-binding protein